ncbi:putative linear pentadecapeptide gramicidin synthetase LgrB [Methylocaldum marinum]|uniref:Putative linear pentadecapeptide gramicidin synthetase LgrB n=1 Tax=Methylocaldum marinum TaxID=1432792 RepID=A0A250KNF1_9GAMM|nr:putative linear pentadecapeptide gramicidin synthetase LgrB [Methylocaldum marinum]
MYFEQLSGILEGNLDITAFQWAWQKVLERHPSLRTGFLWEGLDEPLQVVRSNVTLPWIQEDWREISPSEQPERLEAFLAADRARGFELSQAPLMRCALLRIAERQHYFVWSRHHLLLDGWSLPRVLKDVMDYYAAHGSGREPRLAYTRPYRDYIAWLLQQDLEQAERFWRETLQGFTAPTPLPIGRTETGRRPDATAYEEQSLRLSAELTGRLQALARAHRLTFNTLVQGVWALLLARYSGEADVLFGATVSGRPAELAGVENMVGLFINTLPVRVRVPAEANVLPWLEQLQAQHVERDQYAYSPLVDIQGWSEVPRGLPLFESLVVFENYPVDAALTEQSQSLQFRDIRALDRTNYPLTLLAVPGSELSLVVVYDAHRFEAATIARLLTHVETVLGGIAADPGQRLSALPLVPEPEARQLLVEWNATAADYPNDQCLPALFEKQVEIRPDAVAVVFEDQVLTYRALNARVNRLAHHLRALGVGPESRIGLCLERSPEMLVGLLAVLKAGGAYVPLDPAYPQERLAFMLEDAAVSVLLTQAHLTESLPKTGNAPVICLDQLWGRISQRSDSNPISNVLPENLAYIIYTSGSTGRPKGIQISHQSLINFLHSIHQPLGLFEHDIFLAVTTLSFDIAALELYLPLVVGAQMVLVGREAAVDGTQLLEKLKRSGATVMQATPATWRLLLAAGWEDGKQLKILCGGEALPRELAQQLLKKGRSVWNLYGPTEATIWSAIRQVSSDTDFPIEEAYESIGRPIANTEIYILDAQRRPVPIGVPGELCIGGVGLARGYLHRPELTAEKFIPHPFSRVPGARLYRTGDLARWRADGTLEFLGRIDHQVKLRGFRIELGEIEAALSQQPGVRDAVVLLREDAPGEKRLVAYAVGAVDPETLRTALKAQLPDYMVPTAWVTLDALPLTPNGKVDRKALPAPERDGASAAYVPPQTPTEELLAGIWAELFGHERVGRHDDFFALGGHSLRAIQVVSRVRETLGLELPVRHLFEHPTLADLAAALDATRHTPTTALPPLTPVSRHQPLRLAFAQERLWFLDQLEGPSATYTIPGGLELHGPLEVAALRRSLAEIVRRHESLRTTFPTVDGVAVQHIAPSGPVPLPLIDLAALPDADRAAAFERRIADETRRPFDLAHGPLLRASLVRLAPDRHGLLLNLHHIVSDGWSMAVLVRELSTLYAAYALHQPAALPPLPIQYADYAQWQRTRLSGEVLDRQLRYWQQQLAGAPTLLELPTDHPRPPVQRFHGATRPLALDPALTQALRALSRRLGATLFMTLLSAFLTLLARYSRQDDLVVGTPVANRNRRETEGLIGFFVNTLVLRVDLAGNPAFEEVVARVRQRALDAYAHQEVPFERIVEAVQPERSLSHSPLFQVMFVLQNTPEATLTLPGLTLSPLPLQGVAAKFDLTLVLSDSEAGLHGVWEYSTDLFEAETIDRLGRHFDCLLRGIVADPTQRLSALPLLPDAEAHQLLVAWNATDTDYPKDRCIHQLFEARAETTPDAVAVVFEDQVLTYRALDARANQLAHHLQALGVGPESRIGLCLERAPELVVGLLGVLKAGAAYVPLDPAYPRERLAFMLEDAAVSVLLTQARLRESLPETSVPVLCLDQAWATMAQRPDSAPVSGVGPENLAYVIYTSGSTGKPKGVMIVHQGLINYLSWCTEAYAVADGNGTPVQSSIGFDATITSIFPALLVGRPVILLPEKQEIEGLSALLQAQRDLSLVKITPAHLDALGPLLSPKALSGQARALILGGEALTMKSLAVWRTYAPETRLINEYGPTETVVGCCVYEVPPEASSSGAVPIGRPIANTQLYVLDERFRPVPIGVPGELHIGGDGVARGYLYRPELTAEKFIPHPFSRVPGARLYRTGDLARWRADGELEFLGRIDHQVKLRGFRIELGEIEAALSQQPGIRDAVVLLREDAPGEKRLVAYCVGAVDPETLRAALKAQLPDYMVPAAWVTLDALPLTPNGKVDRKALPAPERGATGTPHVPPQGPTEARLAEIWAEVLRLDRVGRHDNFFALGGDSILSIQIVARATQAGLPLTPRQLFQHQSIAELAAGVGTSPARTAEQGPVQGDAPLTPIQHWFFDQAWTEPHHFNQAFLLSVAPDLAPDRLRQVLHTLRAQHDALRLRFHREAAHWRQTHAAPDAPLPFGVVDLAALPPDAQAAAIEQVSAAQQARLDLAHGPLWRCVLFTRGEGQPGRLLLVIHHLAVDGVSWRILLDDLQQAYARLGRGAPPALPPKTTAFKTWAEQLDAYAASERLRPELAYWQRLRGPAAPLPRDADAPPEANTVAAADHVAVTLGREPTRALLHDVPPVYRTRINDVLLTALAQTLARWSGVRTLWVNLEGHGREELFEGVDLARTVGWFTTLYPVRLDLTADAPGEALKAVKEQLRTIPQGGIGYGVLRYRHPDPAVRASLAALPAPELSFNYLGQLDTLIGGDLLLGLAPEGSGLLYSPRGQRPHLLDINGFVMDGQLRLDWAYCPAVHRRATVEALAQGFLDALQALIAHCQSPEAGGFTPSDFPLARLDAPTLARLPSRQVEDIYPLSSMQQGMLFHTLHVPESGLYFEQLSGILDGDLDVAAFERAWQYVLERHPSLRTGFLWEGLDEPLQVVRSNVTLSWHHEDWREISPSEQPERLEAFLAADRARGFELGQAPLMRCALLRIAEAKYYFVWSYHHLLLDGWSLPRVLGEISACYAAYSRGQAPQLSYARPYRDYIAWLQRQDLEQAERFWRETLQGFTAPTPLPIGRSETGRRLDATAYDEQTLKLSAALTGRLQALARAHRLTFNTLVQGVWALLLARYSGEADVLFGATVSGRPAELAGVEDMVGLFINTLPVRVRVPAEADVLPWLAQLQAQQAERDQYAYSPLVEIQGWSDVPRGIPLFESLVVFENYPIEAALAEQAHEVQTREVRTVERTNYPLTLVAALVGSELSLKVVHDAERFEAATIIRLLTHAETVLGGMAANPEQRLSELPLVPDAEAHQLLVAWNATDTEYPKDRCIHQLFEARAETTPDAVAVVFEDQVLTYRALDARANQLAHHLRTLGVGPEQRVGLCLERAPDLVVGLLGVLKAGAAYVPLDPAYPRERLAFMLEDAAVSVLLTQARLRESLPETSVPVLCLDQAWATMAQRPDSAPVSGVGPENLAYIIYTSGSTGKPKGTLIEHRQVTRLFDATEAWFGFDGNDVWSLFHSYAFDFSVWEIWGALFHGGRLVVVPFYTARSPGDFYHLVCRERVTVLNQTPSAFRQLIAAQAESREVHCLRYVIFGGEALEVATLRPWYRQNESRNTRLINMYGITETTVHVTFRPLDPSDTERSGGSPIGCRIPDLRVYILDPYGQPVPIGVAGELYVGGAGVGRGYLNRPELTVERFVPDPFGTVPGARLYRTGDLARRRADGELEFLGRIDHQVKLRGFRIELGEIEAALSQQPGIRDAVVLLREDAPGEKRLVAYTVGAVDPETLRTALKAQLPDYMVPTAWVTLDALPLTPNGKVDRKTLPAPERDGASAAYVPPQTPTEELLAGIWAELFGHERVGRHDDFFALGGHSLRAIQVVSRVRETLGLELPVRHLFEHPTLADLAAALDATRHTPTTALPPLTPVSRHQPLRLAFAQERLWFLDQLEGPSATYTIPGGLELHGPLEVAALRRSLAEIVRRHESLRTTFPTVDGVAVQHIAPPGPVPLSLIDLTALPDAGRAAAFERRIADETRRPFDLAHGPLLRASLVRLAPDRHGLLLNLHHIVSDGWSMAVLVRELSSLYAAYALNQPAALPPLPIQYADYAQWQRTWLAGEVLDRQLRYWQQQLAGAPTRLELPTDHPRPPVQRFHGATRTLALDPALTQALRALSRRLGATLFMTLLSAFLTLLARYSRQDDLVVGTPVANRNRRETEGLIGFFVNTLVLRVDLAGNPAFEEVVARVRQRALDAYAHQEVPFERIVEAVQPERSLSHSPLFQVMFVLQNTPAATLTLPGLTLSPLPLHGVAAKFDLTLVLSDSEAGLHGVWEYSTDLFEAETIDRLGRHFDCLLRGIVADPTQRLSALPLLPDAEAHQLLVDWNATDTEYPKDRCLHQLFEARAEETPDAVAVVFEDQVLTYRDLDTRANQLAHHLRALGVGPDSRVALCVERSCEMVIGLLAVLKAGGAYVPLDPGYPEERLAYMLTDAAPRVLLTHGGLASRSLATAPAVPVIDLGDPTPWAHQPTHNPDPSAVGLTAENLAYVIYTSGSTGKPKGAMNEHRGVVNRLLWKQQAYGLESSDAVLQKTPFSFDVSVWEFFWPLITGARLVMARPEGHKDPAYLTDVIRREKITTLHFVPSMLQAFLDDRETSTCTGLRRVMCSGEALPESLARRFHDRLPQVDLHNLYGPTEAAVDVTAWTYTPDFSGLGIPLGRPISNTRIYILDNRGQPAPIGVPGELCIGGVQVGRGYLNRPELTAEKFIPNPFSRNPGARLYRTGDLARRQADGELEFLGRIDHQVKLRGFRIELGEIEAALCQQPGVHDAVVLLREDAPGEKRLVAYTVGAVDPETLRAALKAQLPDYMVPTAWVALDALPLTPNGKVDRKALPAPERGDTGTPYAPPQGPTEARLAEIWADVLRLERVGRHDNFFALGGDSILSIQIVARATQAGLPLTPRQLFQHQSIAELATVVGTGPARAAEQGPVQGEAPLTPIQHWFFDQAWAEPHHFNQAFLLSVAPDLAPDRLRRVLHTLLIQHDALRLRFRRDQDHWRQTHAAPDTPLPFGVVDLAALSPAAQAAVIEQVSAAQQARLDLAHGPLWRSVLFTRGEGQPGRLLLVIHHLAVDGVSWRILLDDLQQAYARLGRGEPPALPPKTTAFKTWAEQLDAYAASERLRPELDYWQRLRGPAAPLPRDADAPPEANTVAAADHVAVTLDRASTRALLHDVPPVYRTRINDVLLTALAQTLARWSGVRTLWVNLEGHGREELFEGVDLARTVGWFTTLYPVRLDLTADAPGEALKAVKEQLRTIPQGGIGYGVLRYRHPDPAVRASLAALPAPELSFNYLGQLDTLIGGDLLLGPAPEALGPLHSPRGQRPHLLDINGFIADGRLQLDWAYCPAVHRRATVEALAQGFLDALQALIAHCQSPEAGGFTPSDFPEATLSQENLNKFLNKIKQARRG